MRTGWYSYFRPFIGALVLLVAALALVRVVAAAEWVEPTADPPGGNPSGFIRIADPDGPAQAGAQFHVSGSGRIGGSFTVSGGGLFGGITADAGDFFLPTVLFGVAQYSKLDASDRLMVFTTADDAGELMHNRLSLDRDGNLTVNGDLRAERCAGPVYVGITAARMGAAGGYVGANQACDSVFADSHACTAEEVLRSISCDAFTRAGGPPAGTRFWVSRGPPGFTAPATAPANDCRGWTSSSAGELGAFWQFEAIGGRGLLSSCDIAYPAGCCR